MTALFEKILEMSLTSAIVIAVVALIRLFLRKTPRKYAYALWSVAAFRLVCPVSFRAVFSLFRFVRTVEGTQVVQTVTDPVPTVTPGYFDSVAPEHLGSAPPVEFDPDYLFTYPLTTPPAAEIPWYATVDWVRVAAIVWLVGLAALLIYGVVSYLRLHLRMDTAVVLEGRVWQSDRVQSPFILGFVRPKIYLPFGLTDDQRRYVLAHERYHLKRLDHIVRPLSFLILAVHWFNPLVWLAYYLMARDMEMSCDEKVLATEENIRKEYSITLLSFAANRRFPSPSPLAFGESGVKGRIKNALNWKKPSTWVTVIAVIVCIVVIIVCAANPKEPESLETQNTPYDWAVHISPEDVDKAELYIPESTPQQRQLTTDEIGALVTQLKLVPKGGFEKTPKNGSWAFPTERMITLTCGDVEYVLNLGPGPMTVSCQDERVDWRSETHWYVNDDELKQFICKLEDTAAEIIVNQYGYPIGLEYAPYESAECLYMNPLSSVYAGDSGERWFIGTDRVTIYRKSNLDDPVADFPKPPQWWVITAEEWADLFQFSMAVPDISDYNTVMLCTLSGSYGVLYADGELWAIETRGDHIWSVYRMESAAETAPPAAESPITIAVWNVDLTHDEVDETLALTYQEELWLYTLTVTNAKGKILWTSEASIYHAGWNSIYLYKQDGKHYLMQWNPYGSTGGFYYHYEVFSLTEEGKEVPLASNTMEFDVRNEQTLLQLDIGALRAFEQEVNALLEHTIVLISTLEGYTYYSTQEATLCKLWTSMADSWEQQQQYYRDKAADRQADTLAVWPLNDRTVTVLKTDDETVYTLDVYEGDYFLWGTELRTWPFSDDRIFLIYRENGKEYLAEFTGTSRQGVGMYSYRVFTVRPESLDILYENSLYYEAMSQETALALDIEAIRAFETEVNTLFQDADIVCGVDDGEFFYNAGGTGSTVFRWNSDADQLEQEQERLKELQDNRHWEAMTGDEAVTWFQNFLSLNPGVNWYNHAMNGLYDTPSELDLSLIFYGGFGEWDGWDSFAAEEEAWLIDQGFSRHIGAQKRPAKELEAILNEYFYTSLDEVAMPDSWVYYYETDSFYSNTNDVHAAYGFEVFNVDQSPTGDVRIYYNVGNTWLEDPDTGEQVTTAVLILRLRAADEFGTAPFIVVSHQALDT